MTSWFRSRTVVWDVTAPRAFALVGRTDLLFAVTGVTVPRIVADTTDPVGDDLLTVQVHSLSELAAAEQHFRHKHRQKRDAADYDRATRLADLRRHPDLRVVDLDDDEIDDMAVLASAGFRKRLGHTTILGPGERAVIATAANREWIAGLDDAAAGAAADVWGVPTMTTQDLLRAAIAEQVISDAEADAVNAAILAEGFYGQPHL